MANLYRHAESGIYYFTWNDPATGKRLRRSLKTHDAKVAAQRHRELEEGVTLGIVTAQTPVTLTLTEIRDAYRQHCQIHKAPTTCAGDEHRMNEFFAAMDVKRLAAVTPAHVEAYQAGRCREVTLATASRDLQTIRAFFKWALELDYIDRNPCAKVKKLVVKGRARPDFLTLDELERLLEAARAPVRFAGPGGKGKGRARPRRTPLEPMIALAAYAGLRLGEIRHQRWEDLELEGERPLVNVAMTEEFAPKDKESRVIPMHQRLRGILRDYRRKVGHTRGYVFQTSAATLYSRDNLLRELRGAAARAGVSCNWYTLRHTFASQLVMAGVSVFKVSKFLGHASVTTTEQYYAHLLPEELHDDVNRIGVA